MQVNPDPNEMKTISEYIDISKKNDKVVLHNFLSKREILNLKTDMNKKSEFVFKIKGKNYKVWQPSKLKVSKNLQQACHF